MKIVYTFIFLLFLILRLDLYGQVATSNCNSVTVSTSNLVFQTNLLIAGGWKDCPECAARCEALYCTAPPTYAQPRHALEREVSPGNWSVVAGPTVGSIVTFNNLAPGKFRVRTQVPTLRRTPQCPNGITVRSCVGLNIIGFRGEFANIPIPFWLISNEVFVGAAQPSDIQWSYIDGDGLNLGDNLFDFNEVVRINTAGTQNYTHWWLAIFELNGAMRYKSTGWNFGAMPTTINLSSFWGQNNWVFENLTSYRVQLAISNQCNTQWTEMSPAPPDFFICPQGSGCRPGDEIVPITLAPNPASYHFSLQNLPTSDVQVHVYDMSGRLVKNYPNTYDGSFDISDINNGIYIIRAVQDGEFLYNGKLSIVH